MFEIEKGIDPNITLVCKLDKEGNIKYINKNYVDITGFGEKDLVGEKNTIIQHPKLPKIISDLAWEKIRNNEDMYFVSRNITKNGEYFWTLVDIRSRFKDAKPTSVFIRRKYLPLDLKEEFAKLYDILYAIETSGAGEKAAKKYLKGWLEDKGGSIHNYIIMKFGDEAKLRKYMTNEVSDRELFSLDPNEMEIDEILKSLKKKKRRFW